MMKTKRKTSPTTLLSKKRKTSATTTPLTKTTPQPNTNPALPYDLLVSCIARVSRLYYPTLSLVSKSFRSLLASPELYKARSLLARTETCLYVCFSGYPKDLWFTLRCKPDQTLTSDKKKSSGYVLAQVPNPGPHSSCYAEFSVLVAVGSKIYSIAKSGSISVLDCTSHTSSKAPSVPVKLNSFSASVVDRKMYLAGCYKDSVTDSVSNSIQVFDTETQIWDPQPIPCSETNEDRYSKTVCIDGKLHVGTLFEEEVVAYDFQQGKWDVVEQGGNGGAMMGRSFMCSDSCCEVENVLYSVSNGMLIWYDTKVRKWRNLEGLVGLPKFPKGACIRLANYGGKLAVFWDERTPYYGLSHYPEKRIWCAVVTLERPTSCEIWGKVEWFDNVLREPYEMVKVLAATV